MLALHHMAEAMREPHNPVNYGRNPIQNNQLLENTENEGIPSSKYILEG